MVIKLKHLNEKLHLTSCVMLEKQKIIDGNHELLDSTSQDQR